LEINQFFEDIIKRSYIALLVSSWFSWTRVGTGRGYITCTYAKLVVFVLVAFCDVHKQKPISLLFRLPHLTPFSTPAVI
jgi:hypothetical protein